MIYSGNSAIADAKYGSQQLAKIYHGADLVWGNDSWTELHIGTPMHVDGALNDSQGFVIAGANGLIDPPPEIKKDYLEDIETNYGFNIKLFNATVGVGNSLWLMLNGSADSGSESYSTAATTSTGIAIHITFPFPFVYNSITLCQAPSYSGTKRPTKLTIRQVNAEQAVISNEPVNSASRAITTINIADDTIQHGTMIYTFGCESTSAALRIGELQMNILVKNSDYGAWKRRYNISNNNIP